MGGKYYHWGVNGYIAPWLLGAIAKLYPKHAKTAQFLLDCDATARRIYREELRENPNAESRSLDITGIKIWFAESNIDWGKALDEAQNLFRKEVKNQNTKFGIRSCKSWGCRYHKSDTNSGYCSSNSLIIEKGICLTFEVRSLTDFMFTYKIPMNKTKLAKEGRKIKSQKLLAHEGQE